jgi:ketosteroid isomerase-like protein
VQADITTNQKFTSMRRIPTAFPHRRLALSLLLTLAPWVLPAIARAQTTFTTPDTTEYSRNARRLLGQERERSAAIARRDTAWLANLYAADFRGTLADGRQVDRDGLFAIFMQIAPGARFTVDEMEVRELGSTAVVTGRLRTLGPGGEVVADSRFLHVYSRRELRYWIVNAAASPVTAPR